MNDFKKTEKDYKLKYFYFIDSEISIRSIIASQEFKKFKVDPNNLTYIEDFFHKVFFTIFESASDYTKFLEPTTIMYSSFFNEADYDMAVAMASLLKLSLRNHCIMHGLFNSLNHCSYISISARNDTVNSLGYFESLENNNNQNEEIEGDKNSEKDKKTDIYQKYRNYYKYLSPKDYSYQILLLFGRTINTKGEGFHFQLPKHMKEFGMNLMTEPAVKTINRNLSKQSSRIMLNYDSLYSSIEDFQNHLTSNADKLLFALPMEYCYCFSTIKSMENFLTEIHRSTIQNNLSLKDLEGQVLLNIISDLSRCRLVYSRHFFLKYACNAVLNSPTPYSSYLQTNSDNLARQIPLSNNQSKNLLANTGLSNVYKFFQTINNFTIPVLEDLWTVCFNQIKATLPNIDLSLIYKNYIENNYDMLTSDFTLLSDEQIKSCNLQNNPSSIDIDTYISPYFSLKNLQQELMHVQNINTMVAPPMYVNNSLKQILYSALNIDKIKSPFDDHLINQIINSDISDVYSHMFRTDHIRSFIDLLSK